LSLILSREAIAKQADKAAAFWVKHPGASEPVNPYDEHIAPAHFKVWRALFQRALLEHSALPETEGSA
jgi:hypothetical protein